MTSLKRVLVCGATGYLGRHVVQTAHARGHRVRALVRDPSRLGGAQAAADEVFVGEATRAETLGGLCDGVQVVVSALGNRTFHRKPTCWEIDQDANMNIVRCARESGVEQFIFVSVLKGDQNRGRVPQIEARERVVDALASDGLPFTIIRPSGFFNDMAEVFAMARKGAVWAIGDLEARFNPIHGADLAEFTVDQIGRPEALGTQLSVGGPDVLSQRELGRLALAAAGGRGSVRSVPAWTVAALATVIRPFNVNVASFLLMLTAMVGSNAVTTTFGTHHLGDFFESLAAADQRSSSGAAPGP